MAGRSRAACQGDAVPRAGISREREREGATIPPVRPGMLPLLRPLLWPLLWPFALPHVAVHHVAVPLLRSPVHATPGATPILNNPGPGTVPWRPRPGGPSGASCVMRLAPLPETRRTAGEISPAVRSGRTGRHDVSDQSANMLVAEVPMMPATAPSTWLPTPETMVPVLTAPSTVVSMEPSRSPRPSRAREPSALRMLS